MKKLMAFVVMSCVAITARADNFRCGKWIVNESLLPTELVAKCGEPDSREQRTEDVYARNVGGGTYRTGAVSVIETWIFKRGTGAAPMVVTIIDGKIESIKRQE
ncbi:MAG TPA: DUF2845 domain-containing protein [Steroidobacteraceae bacterium]|nr:DUF2845 domain-containing protein [Steroidobacteraceae bacterium]